MKVKDLIANLEKRDPEGDIFVQTDNYLLDINEVTFGEHEGKEFTVIIPDEDEK
jgi:hypothetical protein